MIPLVATPPPAPNYGDLVTGDSSLFTAGIGSWVGSTGVTPARDTGAGHRFVGGGSLKATTDAANEYIELPLAGTFLAGVEYQALIVGMCEQDAAHYVSFGLHGTDINIYGSWTWVSHEWNAIVAKWVPTANRSGVTIRVTRTAAGTTPFDLHVGYCRAVRMPAPGLVGLRQFWHPGGNEHGFDHIVVAAGAPGPELGLMHANQTEGASRGLDMGYGNAQMENGDGTRGVVTTDDYLFLYSENGPTGLADAGINIEVGTDYVGLYISEADSGTVEMYADVAGGFTMRLRDRGTAKGWKAMDEDGNQTGLLSKAPWRSATGPPAGVTAVEGDCYYDTTTHKLMVHNGTGFTGCW